ncbi:uncharacterized protein LOC142578168 [Dermacentor variabilis]|uniref:uncharacterized protein LOC142578168 n=1 Tax=Dermacentor variabilis TaxID=34621 RepID=UPI003F5C52AB
MDSTLTDVPILQMVSLNWLYLSLSIALSFLLFAAITSNMNKPRIPKGKKLPPGPRGFPLVGHLPYGPRNFDYKRCLEISKQHGPVFRLKVGVKDIVILNDFESIKDVLTRKAVLNRTDNFILDRSGVKGIVTLNGDAWLDNRRFCLHVLRDLGFGRKSMEEHIKDEVQYLADKILELHGSPVDIRKYLVPSMSNNITSLVFGRRYPFEDRRRKFLDERLKKVLRIIGSGSLFTFLPSWAFFIFSMLPFTDVGKIKEVLEEMFEYVSEEVKQHEISLDENSNRDFIDGYIKKMKENEDNPHSSFKMGNLLGNVLNFFGAGSNTVQLSIQWHLLNCADKVDSVQRNIQNEIDRVVGHERAPCWEDHNKMHFTMATIWEMYRWRTVAPLSIPREAAEDVEYKDYFIPKGTVILPNLSAVHLDPVIWESPKMFDPHRFLKKDGSGLIAKPDQLIPFSIGRRMCPGETLATVEIFLYLTTLLQKFTVRPADGKRVDLEPAAVALNMPVPQQLKFVCREEASRDATRLILTFVLSFVLLIASGLWLRIGRAPKGSKLPPGPPGFPHIGHIPLRTNIFVLKKLKEWTKMYGPVFRVKVGFRNVVVLNDFESIKEALSMKELMNRSGNLVIDQVGFRGLMSLNGQAWHDNRRFCLHVLRDLGFGKTSMEEKLKEEAEYLAERIAEHRGEPFVIQDLLVPSTSNNVTALVFGKRYAYEDARRNFLDDRLKKLSRFVGARRLSALFPGWLNRLAARVPVLKNNLAGPILDGLLDFAKREIQEHETSLEEHSNRDFIDAYLKKIKENVPTGNSSFQMNSLIGNIFSFFVAGSSTVQETLQWHLLVCADKPDLVQRRIQQEIDQVIGRERPPSWADHTAMPFTVAVLWEVYRWRTVTPLGIPRTAAENVVFKSHFIPKGTIVIANLRAVHMNPEYWKDPEEFNPLRFLNEDGSRLLPKPDQLIPFSVGKRMCPGETMATVEIFLYLTTILQKYDVLPQEGCDVNLSSETTSFRLAQRQKLRFLPR